MKKSAKKLLLGVVVGGLAFTSCKKEDPNLTSSENNALADAAFNHLGSVMDEEIKYAQAEAGTNKTNEAYADHDTCANVTWSASDDLSYIDTVIIDYGSGGCEWRGRTKTGKIRITQDGKRNDVGTTTKLELIDFTIDGYPVEGTKYVERTGYDTSPGNWNATDHITVSGAKITSPNGDSEFSWNSDRIHKGGWIEGEFIVLVEGNINGVNTQGTAFTITTGTPLKFKAFCPRIVSGTLNLTPAGMSTRSINYGNGACDFKATVTIDDKDYEIILW